MILECLRLRKLNFLIVSSFHVSNYLMLREKSRLLLKVTFGDFNNSEVKAEQIVSLRLRECADGTALVLSSI